MGHHEMNGGLTSPGVYAGLHISPQMSAAAAAAYGRSPMVTPFPALFYVAVFRNPLKALHIVKRTVCILGNASIHILLESWMTRSIPLPYLSVQCLGLSKKANKRIFQNVKLLLL